MATASAPSIVIAPDERNAETAIDMAMRWSPWLNTRAGRIAPPRMRMTSGVERSISMPTLAYSSRSVSARSLSLCARRDVPVMRLSPSQAAASAASGGKRSGHCVASNSKERTAADGDAIRFVDQLRACPYQCGADGRVGLLRKDRHVVQRHFAGNGSRHEQCGGGAPVAFDAVIGRSVALAAFDVELGVAVVEDLRTEAVCRLDRHIDIRCGDGAPHVDREFAAGGRQREQQAGDEPSTSTVALCSGPQTSNGRNPSRWRTSTPSCRSGAIIIVIGRRSSVPSPSMRSGTPARAAIGVNSRVERPDSPTWSVRPRGARPPRIFSV